MVQQLAWSFISSDDRRGGIELGKDIVKGNFVKQNLIEKNIDKKFSGGGDFILGGMTIWS